MIAHKRQFAHIPGVTYPEQESEAPPQKKASWNALSDYELDQIRTLSSQGVPYKEIGLKIGRSADTVSVILCKQGIRKRKVRDDIGISRKTANPNLLPHA